MTNALPQLPLPRWVAAIETEYLLDYIPSGGSAVKFLTGSESQLNQAVAQLEALAASSGCFYSHLDPSQPNSAGKRPDLHKIDQLFFAVIQQVDWKAWAAEQARIYLHNRGIHLSDGRSLGDLEQIALDNERDPQDLMSQYQRELATPLLRDTRLAIEFRTAITALVRALLIPDAISPTTEEVILGWFSGKTLTGGASALKKVQIYERINLSNARSMLASFCRWLPQTGHSGLVITLDFRAYESKRRTKNEILNKQKQSLHDAIARGAGSEELRELIAEQELPDLKYYYSDIAYMQALTILRRFIDEIDRFDRLLLVILTSPNFYREKALYAEVQRCYFDYDALQTRIGQEVHDANYSNPAASLVHLGGEE